MKILNEILSFIQNAFFPLSSFDNIEDHLKRKLKENLNLFVFSISAILIASLCISVSIILICLNLSLQIEQFKNIGFNAELIGSIVLFTFSSLILISVMLIGHRSLKTSSKTKSNQVELIHLVGMILNEMSKSKNEQYTPPAPPQSIHQ